jgi:hypothetical protein
MFLDLKAPTASTLACFRVGSTTIHVHAFFGKEFRGAGIPVFLSVTVAAFFELVMQFMKLERTDQHTSTHLVYFVVQT